MSFLSEFQIMVKVNPIRKRGRPSSSAAEEQAGSSGKRPARARRAPSRLRDGVDDTPTPSTSKQAHAPPSTAAQDIPIISPAIQKLMTQCISEVTSAFMEQERQLMATFTENILASQTPPAARNEPSDPVSVMPTRASPPPPAAAPQPDNPPLLVTPARAPDVREPEPSTSNTNVSTLMPRPGTSNSPSESPVPVLITCGCPTVRPLQAGGMPLGGAIPERVKEKIWQNKYIELADLLPSDRQSYTLQIYNDSDTPSLNFEPKKRRCLTEAEWIRAFDIYIAIYIDKYPDAANALLTYTHNVQNIMATLWFKISSRTWIFFGILVHCATWFRDTGFPPEPDFSGKIPTKNSMVSRSSASQEGTATTTTPGALDAPDVHAGTNIPVQNVTNHTPSISHAVNGQTKNLTIINTAIPVRVERLHKLLNGCPYQSYIINGFKHGFMLNFEGPECAMGGKNALSALQNPLAVEEKIKKELRLGRVSGPYKTPPFIISSLPRWH